MKTTTNMQVEKKITSGIKGGPFWLDHSTTFFFLTQRVGPFCGVETFTFHEYFLLNFVGDIPQF